MSEPELTLEAVIGKNLKRLRVAAGLSQADLAGLLNWTRDTVASVETGRRELSVGEMLELASFFGVGFVEFFAGDRDSEAIGHQYITKPPYEKGDVLKAHLNKSVEGVRWESAYFHDPTDGIAERLGVTPAVLNRAARSLWGHSVHDEYDARRNTRLPEDDYNVPYRSLATMRGHIVRGLREELEEQLSTRKG
jgi:transcriptional regulator with XRE-family HTH domain